jgi:hypothetical protein
MRIFKPTSVASSPAFPYRPREAHKNIKSLFSMKQEQKFIFFYPKKRFTAQTLNTYVMELLNFYQFSAYIKEKFIDTYKVISVMLLNSVNLSACKVVS